MAHRENIFRSAHAIHGKVEQPSLCLDWILETQQHCPLKITFELTLNHLREWFAFFSLIGSLNSFDLPSILLPKASIFDCKKVSFTKHHGDATLYVHALRAA